MCIGVLSPDREELLVWTLERFGDATLLSVNRLLTKYPSLNLAYFFMILSDLLEALENQRAYPYAEIRRDHVHQSEASDDFEAMDIQL